MLPYVLIVLMPALTAATLVGWAYALRPSRLRRLKRALNDAALAQNRIATNLAEATESLLRFNEEFAEALKRTPPPPGASSFLGGA